MCVQERDGHTIPPVTQLHLHFKALDPMLTLADLDPITVVSDLSIAEDPPSIEPDMDFSPGNLHPSQLQIPHGVLIIGNHADELTSLAPILSIMYRPVGT